MDNTDLGRIVAFSDGVMAVAITLLVLNLHVPDVPTSRLDEELVDLVPSVGTYLLSFALVGRFWVVHHGLFQRVRAFDGRLMALNLLFLALIVLVPFAAELDDRYTSESLAVAVFGTILGLTALVNWMMRMHVERAGLVDRRQPQTDRAGDRFSLWLAVTFLVSVPVAFLSVVAAHLLWLGTVVLRYPLRRLTHYAR